MPLSLKTMLKKFVHKGQITQEEYDALIKKLDGHDREIRSKVIDEFAEKVKPIIDEKIKGWTNSDDLRRWCERAVDTVAEQLKENSK